MVCIRACTHVGKQRWSRFRRKFKSSGDITLKSRRSNRTQEIEDASHTRFKFAARLREKWQFFSCYLAISVRFERHITTLEFLWKVVILSRGFVLQLVHTSQNQRWYVVVRKIEWKSAQKLHQKSPLLTGLLCVNGPRLYKWALSV